MKMRTRIRILKILGVLGLIAPAVAFILDMWASRFQEGTLEYIQIKRIVFILLGIYAIIGVLIVILTSIGGKPEPKPIDKYDLLFGDALQLRHALQGSTAQLGYECLESDEAWLICRRWEKKRCHVFALRFLEEMQREDIGPMYDHMYAVLKENGVDPDLAEDLSDAEHRGESDIVKLLFLPKERGRAGKTNEPVLCGSDAGRRYLLSAGVGYRRGSEAGECEKNQVDAGGDEKDMGGGYSGKRGKGEESK